MNEGKLRTAILEVAAEQPDIGAVEESVKWGQPSFVPKRANVGSPIRIQTNADDSTSLMMVCTTDLARQFRDIYGDTLDIRGDRELRLHDDTDEAALRHCIALALTYKLRKRTVQ